MLLFLGCSLGKTGGLIFGKTVNQILPYGATSRRFLSFRVSPLKVTLKQFLNFDVMWFFANLIIYGLAMSVVESFLLVFLNEA